MEKEPWYITKSKENCKQIGLSPKIIPVFTNTLTNEQLEKKRKDYEEILGVIRFFVKKMLNLVEGIPLQIGISDGEGCILEIPGNSNIQQSNNELGIHMGMRFTEKEMGVNSISLALQHRQPIQVIGTNHFFEPLHSYACYSVPFEYSDENKLLGTITIMTSIVHQSPVLLAILSTLVDSIERELLLRKQNHRLYVLNQIMMNASRNGIIITDKDGIITEINEFVSKHTECPKDSLIGKPVSELKPIGDYISNLLLSNKKCENMEIRFQRRDGSGKSVCLFDAFPVFDQQERLIGAFGQFRDITEHYEAKEKINYLAFHDDLTILPNRRFFMERLNDLINTSKKMIAVMFLDLDRFKVINDTLGHSTGDLLLKLVANRLKNCLGSNGMVARMGGDEFTILLSQLNKPSEAAKFAEKLVEEFNKPIILYDYELYINISIGIAFHPANGKNVETLMKHADIAMYRAKESDRKYEFYSPEENGKALERLTLESALRKALQNEELVLHYQPQINIKTGKIMGLEALIRWIHPELGMISPGTFIPIAEQAGLIAPIDNWVLKTACKQNKKWQQAGLPPVKVAVNLSSHYFLNQNIIQNVKATLEETGLEPQYLELEITESMAMDVNIAIKNIKQLKFLGVEISIDDFGTGYSSLYYLKKLAIDRLKIDQSFVRDIMTDSNNADIVATIIVMAHKLGLDVIAEGVETTEQLDFLKKQECEEVQGFLFSKPLPTQSIESLLLTGIYLKNI